MTVLPLSEAPRHDLDGTRFTSLATPRRGTAETSVWQVEIAPGTPATPHSLTREEVFVVLGGRAEVRLDTERFDAGPGDAIVVPPGVELELRNGDDEPLRLLCCLPVGGQAVVGTDAFTPPWAQ
ncbi:cupin domain-containing protein [Oryzobacter terrae]|uniref:cupin domain-containing protein n=1 Tax=Oryzobacter terrae TaxID=1620385 RepID=UPI00366A64DD